jgi:hypothetical protein
VSRRVVVGKFLSPVERGTRTYVRVGVCVCVRARECVFLCLFTYIRFRKGIHFLLQHFYMYTKLKNASQSIHITQGRCFVYKSQLSNLMHFRYHAGAPCVFRPEVRPLRHERQLDMKSWVAAAWDAFAGPRRWARPTRRTAQFPALPSGDPAC